MVSPLASTEPSSPQILLSEMLGDRVHGFSTRRGGGSRPPFDTLNLGRGVGDDPAAVEDNLGRLARAAGFAAERLFTVEQVHGSDVVVVEGTEDPMTLRRRRADVLLTRAPNVTVAVRVADCVPVLLAACGGTAVAAVHAGWRGVVAGVVGRAVEALLALAESKVSDLRAAIGVGIGACCFEVGAEVAGQIAERSGAAVVQTGGSTKPRVDLQGAIRVQLAASGLSLASVESLGGCTRCEPERFFSHRRDGAKSGRLMAFISPAPARRNAASARS